jgi:hypothetical protein
MEPVLRKTYVNLISQNVRDLSQQKNEQNEKNIYMVIPEELQQNHNHEKFPFLIVLVLLAQCIVVSMH